MKLRFFVDTHKGLTFAAVLVMMAIFDRWGSPAAWVYLALHGTYGLLWVLKSRIFPDQQWEKRVGWGFGLISWLSLTLYWIPALLVMTRADPTPPWLLALSIGLYATGLFFHFASDMQKHTALRLHPGQLISDGLFALSRNPNYFGELLIYAAFALLTVSWLGFVPLALFIIFYWIPNMRRKDTVLAQMEGFEEYRKKTKWFIPFVF
jgi:steroid 5-alpha reductase family enzyme